MPTNFSFAFNRVESFTSLYQQLMIGLCPYFYLCCHQFTVLFRGQGVGGYPQHTACLTPSTCGIREALNHAGRLRLAKKHVVGFSEWTFFLVAFWNCSKLPYLINMSQNFEVFLNTLKYFSFSESFIVNWLLPFRKISDHAWTQWKNIYRFCIQTPRFSSHLMMYMGHSSETLCSRLKMNTQCWAIAL